MRTRSSDGKVSGLKDELGPGPNLECSDPWDLVRIPAVRFHAGGLNMKMSFLNLITVLAEPTRNRISKSRTLVSVFLAVLFCCALSWSQGFILQSKVIPDRDKDYFYAVFERLDKRPRTQGTIEYRTWRKSFDS